MNAPELTQCQGFPLRKRIIRFSDDGNHLKVSVQHGGNLTEYQVNVGHLNPEPMRERNRNYRWALGILVWLVLVGFGAVLALALWAGGAGWFCWVVLGCDIPLATVILVRTIYVSRGASHDLLVYLNRFNGKPELLLDWNLPSESKFGAFMEALKSRIEESCATEAVTDGDSPLGARLRELASLREQELLSEEEFETLRNALLDRIAAPERRIGFA